MRIHVGKCCDKRTHKYLTGKRIFKAPEIRALPDELTAEFLKMTPGAKVRKSLALSNFL